MAQDPGLSRRSFIGSVVGGMALGGLWGAAFPALAMENRPTIAVVGHRNAQLALVDSSDARALILVGDPDETLMETLPAVMTLFRQRIDLVIASQSVLLRHAGQLRDRWSIRHAISLQPDSDQTTPAMPTTSVTGGIDIDLGAAMAIQCRIGHRSAWDSRSPETQTVYWTIAVTHTGGSTVIAPEPASLDIAAPGSATLLISPDVPPPGIAGRMPVQAFACNHDSESLALPGEPEQPLTRIYPQDIARFVLHDAGIDLPPWTQQP